VDSRTRGRAQQAPAETFPAIPEDISATDLDREIRAELRPLTKTAADMVARRLVAAGELLDSEPAEALAHATAARRLAPRIGAVREALGLAAYRTGEWKLAISELRAYQRLSGRQTHLAVIADCERALGRPERAIDIYRTVDPRVHRPEEHAELVIVASGARRDLGQFEAAAAMLHVPALRDGPREPWVARLRYAYAEVILESGDERRARQWLQRAVDADPGAETGAAERLLELDGVLLDEVEPEPEDSTE
jgi:tetratricopeptide (TPR) repeat protein